MAGEQVNFGELKAKLSIERVLEHFGLLNGLRREREILTGPCPFCKGQGFKADTAKSTFRHAEMSCRKNGSIIDFVMALKQVGMREAGAILRGILEEVTRPQVRETPAASETLRKGRKRKGRGAKQELPPVDPSKEGREIVKAIEVKLGEVNELVGRLVRLWGSAS